jgi:hypothetical protein
MRCVVVLVVALGACEFHSSSAATGTPPPAPDAAADDAAVDAASTPPADAATDAPPAAPFCDSKDPHLVACYDFEGDAKDRSKNRLDAHTHNVNFVPGKVGMAMQFAANSDADADNNNALDIQALTIEAWINPSQLPSSTAFVVILDVDRQYALHLYGDGSVVCVLVGAPFNVPATTEIVAVNQWTHVACTYDNTAAAAYVNGVSTVPVTGGNGLGTQGNTGLSIAADNNPSGPVRARMIGLIDQVRLMDIARTPAQICADAERSSCP